MVGHALALLNWNGLLAKFHPARAEHRERFPNVTIAKLARALESEDENVMKDFDPVDQAIRDCFDGFLGHLERFNRLIETRRLRHEEIFHHLCEWIELIGRNDGTHQPPGSQVIDKLWKYIDAKGYRHTQQLFEKFGYTIKPR
ncbi:MAG: hypothetical protein OEV08_03720 [Nitrospira sp.]|nr:hypothetical protein [Nitrospira sp.]